MRIREDRIRGDVCRRIGVGVALPATAIALSLAAGAAAAEPDNAAGLKAFEGVRAVLQHPRCQNCHIPGDSPLQLDQGRPHTQNVQRGPAGMGNIGMQCATCHGEKNPPASYGTHVPPGAPHWGLPPPQTKMVFIGLSPRELCSVIKDPQKTRGKDLDAMLEHVSHDKLVAWGWNPGPGRSLPLLTHGEFVSAFQDWMKAGAPCPQS